ncbi:MAG: cell wall hydrolase [Lachnospiraceae bacterium]|nr:cell wall hydrolase [Lachnospiraceae bacterium]
MFFKKFAMFVLTIGMATGVMMTQPVKVAAEEAVNAVVETNEENNNENTEDEQEATPEAPKSTAVATAQPKVTKTPAMSKGVKKIVTTTKGSSKSQKTKKEKKKTTKKYSKKNIRLMASIINCEAGGESFQGQIAVGIVVMNRVKSKGFPNTIKGVIYQKGQFSPVRNGMLRKKLNQYDAGKIHSKQWKSCIKAAKKALSGQQTVKIKGKTRSMKGIRFFSVGLPNAKFRLGGHRFK